MRVMGLREERMQPSGQQSAPTSVDIQEVGSDAELHEHTQTRRAIRTSKHVYHVGDVHVRVLGNIEQMLEDM